MTAKKKPAAKKAPAKKPAATKPVAAKASSVRASSKKQIDVKAISPIAGAVVVSVPAQGMTKPVGSPSPRSTRERCDPENGSAPKPAAPKYAGPAVDWKKAAAELEKKGTTSVPAAADPRRFRLFNIAKKLGLRTSTTVKDGRLVATVTGKR